MKLAGLRQLFPVFSRRYRVAGREESDDRQTADRLDRGTPIIHCLANRRNRGTEIGHDMDYPKNRGTEIGQTMAVLYLRGTEISHSKL
jgi:hypothetical protein